MVVGWKAATNHFVQVCQLLATMEEEAEEWLNDLGLREFVPKFKNIGIMEVDDFSCVDGSHLDEMGLTRYQVLNVVL